MKEYTGDRIRNVAIVGNGGAGTTSVTEALLYRSGAISRMCKVEDGADRKSTRLNSSHIL